MDTADTAIEMTVESVCGELVVDARRGSIFHRVHLSVGEQVVKSRFGRVRWHGAPPPRDSIESALAIVATSGEHQARWVAEHASPVPVTVAVEPDAKSYKPVTVSVTADGACVEPRAMLAFDEHPLTVEARSPWHAIDARVQWDTDLHDTETPWGPALAVDWKVLWNGWTVDSGRVEAPLAPPRFDLDGDGITVREGDPDDHDPTVGGVTNEVLPETQAYPWSATAILAGGAHVSATLVAGQELWYAIDVPTAGPLGALPLHVTADAPVWVEVWDGGPFGSSALPPGQLAAMTPMIYVNVKPGADLAPHGPDSWTFAIRAGDHPPFMTDDVWKAAAKPTKNTLWGITKFVGAVIATTVTGVLDMVSAIPAIAGAKIETVPSWTGPSLAAHTRIYVRLTPADASVLLRTATISLAGS